MYRKISHCYHYLYLSVNQMSLNITTCCVLVYQIKEYSHNNDNHEIP